MRKLRTFLMAAVLAVSSFVVLAPSADAVVCHDYPGGCCDYPVLNKYINC